LRRADPVPPDHLSRVPKDHLLFVFLVAQLVYQVLDLEISRLCEQCLVHAVVVPGRGVVEDGKGARAKVWEDVREECSVLVDKIRMIHQAPGAATRVREQSSGKATLPC